MFPSTGSTKFITLAGIASFLAVAACYAGQAELATVAAMKLSEASNYCWTTTVDDDARTYAIDGQTNLADKGDLSLVNLPMVASVRRRLARSTANSDNMMTAAYSGDEKVVIQTADGWRKPEQLTSSSDSNPNTPPSGWGGGMGPMMGRRGRRGMGGMGGSGYPTSNEQTNSSRLPAAYSNLQLMLSRPHEELGIIVAGYTDIKMDGDTVSGTLSETAAKLLLVHAGQKEITPLTGSGTFRLWVKDGVILKYEVKLEGTLAVKTNGDRHEVTVHETATTEIKNIGATKFDVPAEAKKKLGVVPAA